MSLLAPLPGAGLDCLLAAIDAMHTPLPAPARKPLDAADDVVTRKTGAVKTAGRRCKALLVHSLCRSQPSCAVHTCAVCSYETRANSMSVPLRRRGTFSPVCGNCWEFFERTSRRPAMLKSLHCAVGSDNCSVDMMRTGTSGLPQHRHAADVIFMGVFFFLELTEECRCIIFPFCDLCTASAIRLWFLFPPCRHLLCKLPLPIVQPVLRGALGDGGQR